jgi:hypothetical protein
VPRRSRNAIGLHVWLHCADWDASTVLGAHLGDAVARLEARSDLTVRVSKEGVSDSSDWRQPPGQASDGHAHGWPSATLSCEFTRSTQA